MSIPNKTPDRTVKKSKTPKKATIADLEKLNLAPIPGLSENGYSVVAIFRNGVTEVGYIDGTPAIKPIAEIKKLATASRVIRGEETHEIKVAAAHVTRVAVSRMEANAINPVVPIDIVQHFSGANQIWETLNANEASILENRCAAAESIAAKIILTDQCKRIALAIERYLLSIVSPQRSTLKEEALAAGVPKWTLNKLTKGRLNILATSNLARVFFPVKTEKTLTLTIGEIRNNLVFDKYRSLLTNSRILVSLCRNDASLMLLGGAREADPGNESWRRVLDFKIPILPQMVIAEYNASFTSLSQEKPREGNENLTYFVRSVWAIFVVQPVTTRLADFLAVYPVENFDPNSRERPRVQTLALIANQNINILNIANNPERVVINLALSTPLRQEVHDRIRATPNFDYATVPPAVAFDQTVIRPYQFNPPPTQLELANAQNPNQVSSARNVPLPRVKKARPSQAQTGLGRDGLDLIRDLEENPSLRASVIEYLSSFNDKGIQGVAARKMAAQEQKRRLLAGKNFQARYEQEIYDEEDD